MTTPLTYLTNIPGDTSCAWQEVPSFTLQWYNNQGDYQIGDGPTYTMMTSSQQGTPFEWHSTVQPIEDIGGGNFLSNYNGSLNVYFQTRFKGDTTQQQFLLLVNDTPVHSYQTPLVHNGFHLDVSFQFSLVVANGDKLRVDTQGYANVGDTTVLDFDDNSNPNTLLKFYK